MTPAELYMVPHGCSGCGSCCDAHMTSCGTPLRGDHMACVHLYIWHGPSFALYAVASRFFFFAVCRRIAISGSTYTFAYAVTVTTPLCFYRVAAAFALFLRRDICHIISYSSFIFVSIRPLPNALPKQCAVIRMHLYFSSSLSLFYSERLWLHLNAAFHLVAGTARTVTYFLSK